MKIIHSAVVQLTLWYLGLIMILSIGFSLILYRISADEINRGLRRQGAYLNFRMMPREFDSVQDFRDYELEIELGNVRQHIFLFNIATLLLGGAASYALARRTLQPIEEAMNRQSRFTADASHELRTPLTAIQTEIEVALRDPSLSKAQAKELLTSNLEEVAKLRALSDGLLRLAQRENQEIPKEPVQLSQVVAEAYERVARSAETKNINLHFEPSDILVQGDKASLTELLIILLDNAIKYSGQNTAVKLDMNRHSKQAVINVRDQGVGIKAGDLPHIFDRFYRVDTSRSKESADGYGLGLSIAQQIVELHGGSIEAKSTPGQGSVFTVKLPLGQDLRQTN